MVPSRRRAKGLVHAFRGIDDHQRDICRFHMLSRHHHRKFLCHQVRFAFAPDSRRIDKTKPSPVALHHFVHRIARRSRDR